jgi:hypothetical protein
MQNQLVTGHMSLITSFSCAARISLAPHSFSAGGCSTKITEDVRKYAAEQGVTEEAAVQKGLEQKATEFTKAGAEIYAKT